ncbi:MAG: TorF family putative porin [Gallionellaceae bacterium]|jgi:uncharacterized protein (TIGR02001 family)
MLKTKLLVVALGAAFAFPVMAEDAPASDFTPSSNVSLVSDYLYRGISQTGTKPAIQGGFDLAHSSGLYVGVWGSSISTLGDVGIPNSGTEIDTYGGYKMPIGDLGLDVGFLRYNYPGKYAAGATTADTNELYAAVSYSIVTAKLSYSLGDTFGVAKAGGTIYPEVNASYTLADQGVVLGGHVGTQIFAGANKGSGDASLSYLDFKVSASKDFSGYVAGLAISGTNAKPVYTVQGNKLGKTTAVLSLSRAF